MDARPEQCRFRLQDEGKPYPRSSCKACGKSVMTGLGTHCAMDQSPSGRVEEMEIVLRAALSFMQGRHTDPNDGHAVMVIAALRGALAKRERD